MNSSVSRQFSAPKNGCGIVASSRAVGCALPTRWNSAVRSRSSSAHHSSSGRGVVSRAATSRGSPGGLPAHRNVANALRRPYARRQRLAQVHLECIVLAHLGDPDSHHAGQGGQQRLGGFLRGPCLLEADGHVRSYASFTLRAWSTAAIGFAYVSPLPLDPPWSPPAKSSAAPRI